jgi:glycosyltransferase involved in cell wall biosynthesis
MGGANYVRHLAAAVRAAAPDARLSFVCGDPLRKDWQEIQPLLPVAVRRSLRDRFFKRGPSLATVVDRAGIDFVYPVTYDNAYNLGVHFPIGRQFGSAAWAGWIPDFQHRYLPELFPPEEIRRRETLIAQLVVEAPCVVLSSRSAARDYQMFYPRDAAKAEVLTFATTPFELSPNGAADGPDTPDRFFLVCNQFWKHKNHLVVFDALRILRAQGVRPLVLCTGHIDDYRDRAFADEIRAALDRDGITEQVRLLGLVTRPVQVELMRRALAIVQPSLFEGWSTVVEDARALGRPSLLSDLAVHREQSPPHAHFFPPRDPEALARLISEAWSSWKPGPDRAAEEDARKQAEERLVEVGRTFLEIAARSRR